MGCGLCGSLPIAVLSRLKARLSLTDPALTADRQIGLIPV